MAVSLTVMNKKLVSTHGKLLIRELCDPPSANLAFILQCIEKDVLSARFKDAKTGDCAFHLLLRNNLFDERFILECLKALIARCPKGLEIVNAAGDLPLHVYFLGKVVKEDVVRLLIDGFPGAARRPTSSGLLPIFLCVMKEGVSFDICKMIVQANPDGVKAKTTTSDSYPLHFSARRPKPNPDVIRMLLRRYPEAARAANNYGLLPLHCLCGNSDNIEVAMALYVAHPQAAVMRDNLGRTCLHLAVLLVGKDHALAVSQEEDEFARAQQQQQQQQASDDGNGDAECEQNSSDDEDDGNRQKAVVDGMNVKGTGMVSRRVVEFLISVNPSSLVTYNNFNATAVDTVLEKTRPGIKSRYKRVQVWGLFDDPITARMLLLAHRNAHQVGLLPPMKASHAGVLRELNWHARRTALRLSFVGCDLKRLRSLTAAVSSAAAPATPSQIQAAVAIKMKQNLINRATGKRHVTTKPGNAGDVDGITVAIENMLLDGDCFSSPDKSSDNLFSRLRRKGYDDCLRICISFI